MKSFRGRLPGLIAAVLLTGLAVAQNSLTPVPECGVPEIKNDTLFIVNSCGINVTSFYTSRGDVWGGTIISPGQEHRTAYSGEAIARVGGVSVYTCQATAHLCSPTAPRLSATIADAPTHVMVRRGIRVPPAGWGGPSNLNRSRNRRFSGLTPTLRRVIPRTRS
jgi:hypothetical protein